MQGLRTNYTFPMGDCHTVQYRCVMIIFIEQFNNKSPPLTADGKDDHLPWVLTLFSIEN